MDYHDKTKKQLADKIKELESSLAITAHGPAVKALRKENARLQFELSTAKAEIIRLHGELVKLDTPIDFTVSGENVEYLQ